MATPRYLGQPLHVDLDAPAPEVGTSREELIDGMAQVRRELAELQEYMGTRDPTPGEQDTWDGLLQRFAAYERAVRAIDNAPPE